jgi:hypothetical protein
MPPAALRGLKNLFEKRFLRISKNFWENLLAEFLAVLFSPNGSRTHVGPLPHKIDAKDCFAWEREEQAPPLPDLISFP